MKDTLNMNTTLTSSGTSTVTAATKTQFRSPTIASFLQSDYVKIEEGETRVLTFLKGMETVVKKEFQGKAQPDKLQYIVYDNADPRRKELKFELSKKQVAKLEKVLDKFTTIECSKTGTGFSVDYTFRGLE
jgi:hypothetical protein